MVQTTIRHQRQLNKLIKISLALFLFISGHSFSQENTDSLVGRIDPAKWVGSVEKRLHKLEDKIGVKNQMILIRLQAQEENICKKLNTRDSTKEKIKLEEINKEYMSLKENLARPVKANIPYEYISSLDTLSSALTFFEQKGFAANVKQAVATVSSFRDRLKQSYEIKKFIEERKQQLKAQLENLGLVKDLKKFNKEFYYYSEQINEYKELLKDSKKAEKKALELLSKTKFFQDFMRKNSQLAALFRLPGDSNDPSYQASFTGLQTRTQVNNLIQQQLSSGGSNAMQQFRQNIQEAKSQLNQFKDKVIKAGKSTNSDDLAEGFKPNSQKTKSFFKRLQYSLNIQSQRATSYFPVTTDFGFSLGYKLNDKSILGIGASYKLGWGRGWQDINITSQGVGLRSFIDLKIKGILFLSGGYELNYKSAFNDFNQLRNLNQWQKSGFIGLTKSFPVRGKFFRNTKLQLLWDFLSYEQRPRTQAIIFRIGYNFSK